VEELDDAAATVLAYEASSGSFMMACACMACASANLFSISDCAFLSMSRHGYFFLQGETTYGTL